MIKVEYIQKQKTLDELKKLIQTYLENNGESTAKLTVGYFQDEKGNYTNDGKVYVKVQQEIYSNGKWEVRVI